MDGNEEVGKEVVGGEGEGEDEDGCDLACRC